MSGAKAARPGLNRALEVARAGDVLTVWRLDRLGRSLHDLILLGRMPLQLPGRFPRFDPGGPCGTSLGSLQVRRSSA